MFVFSMGSGVGKYLGQTLNEKNPLRRDTVLIPAFSWTILRFVTDNRTRLLFWLDAYNADPSVNSWPVGLPLP